MTTRRSFLTVLIGLMISLAMSSAYAGTRAPYIGNWSNGRGETLVVTSRSLQPADDDPIAFEDVTRVTDGNTFIVHITTKGKINRFDGKYLSIELTGRNEMTITQYNTYDDCFNGQRPGSTVNWSRD